MYPTNDLLWLLACLDIRPSLPEDGLVYLTSIVPVVEARGDSNLSMKMETCTVGLNRQKTHR